MMIYDVRILYVGAMVLIQTGPEFHTLYFYGAFAQLLSQYQVAGAWKKSPTLDISSPMVH